MLLSDCCQTYFSWGESVCLRCNAQLAEYRKEREAALNYQVSTASLKPATQSLLQQRSLPAAEFGGSTRAMRALAAKNPNRRRVFELFGFYLPEREARDLLKKVHDFKWIEAEKVGFDIWDHSPQNDPFSTAATSWAARHLNGYMEYRNGEAA